MTNEPTPLNESGLLCDFQVHASVNGSVTWELFVPGHSGALFSGWAENHGELHGQLHKAMAGVENWYATAVRSTPGGRPHAPGRNAR